MTREQVDIERIVREVIRRLAETPDLALDETKTTEPPVRKPPGSPSAQKNSRLQLSERVVTTALLDRKLDGIKQIVVPVRAIVTPAVRDMLRKKRIAVVEGAEAEKDVACRAKWFLAVVDPTGDFGSRAAAVAAELGDAQRWDGDCVVKAIRRVTDAVVDEGCTGIVFTSQPSVALCRGNRHSGVRAAWGVDVAAVKEAVQSIGANVLVVNPALHSVFELRGILREFASGNHTCPKQYRDALES
jgi:hypothetical protein